MDLPTRSDAIFSFLQSRTRQDMADLYNDGMEVQVNVGQKGGQRKELVRGSRAIIWTDGVASWYSYRIPKNAWAIPDDNSGAPQSYPLDEYVEGIGLTGWNFQKRSSIYVAYDFDALVGHSDKHAKKLSPEELEAVKHAACEIPWVTVRTSTGGYGLHLYVFLDPMISTENHSEHAALARAILGYMSGLAGYDFTTSVDTCGGNIWVWHQKYELNRDKALKCVKKGVPLTHVPLNWRDHVPVASSRASGRAKIGFIKSPEEGQEIESLSGEFARIPLDDVHRGLLRYLDESGSLWWYDVSRHMLVCHTADLKHAHIKLNLRGVFETTATGKEHGMDHNCFAYPLPEGAWVVRRYTKGVGESACWTPDKSGYQRCYYNAAPDLDLAARLGGAVQSERGDYEFASAEAAIEALRKVNVAPQVELPRHFLDRRAVIKILDDGVSLRVARTKGEPTPLGWSDGSASQISLVLRENIKIKHEDTLMTGLSVDDQVRHLVDGRQGSGWAIRAADSTWYLEQESAVSSVLSHRFKSGAIKKLIGSCILSPWVLVNLPFQPEYPGDRRWNRDAAQFRFHPAEKEGDWVCPTWRRILDHCGIGLTDAVIQNDWCRTNNILTGGDYLLLWTACMFRKPEQPLPYLFFFGPQNSGKSIFHQALGLLFLNRTGYVRAEATLQSAGAFNGEIAGAVLCVVEEVDLSGRGGKMALTRIKDYVGSDTIGLHVKGKTVILVQNTTHWVHCANDPGFCPIFPDDSRITMSLVPSLTPGTEIPKMTLLKDLEKEAAEFVGLVLSIDLPEPNTRLAVPVINTSDKLEAAALNASLVQQFITEKAKLVEGHAVPLDDFFNHFCDWIGKDAALTWTKQRISREMALVPGVVRGRYQGATWHYGNVSLDVTAEPVARLIKDHKTETLYHEGSRYDRASEAERFLQQVTKGQ